MTDPHISEFLSVHGLSQAAFADLLPRCSQVTISKWISSGRDIRVQLLGRDDQGRMKVRTYEIRNVPAHPSRSRHELWNK